MQNNTALAQQILNEAREKRINLIEMLPTAIAAVFGLWALRREGRRGQNLPQAGNVHAFLGQALECMPDPASREAFRSLLQEETFKQLFGGGVLDRRNPWSEAELIWTQETLIRRFAERYCKGDYAPEWLHRLAVLLLQPCGGNFYDGAAGVGDAVAAAHRFGAAHSANACFYAAEQNETMRSILILRAQICGIRLALIPKGADAPLPPEQADWSIMFPPLGDARMLDPDAVPDAVRRLTHDVPISRDWLYPLLQIAALGQQGRGVCCVFNGMLFNARHAAIRQRLLELNVLDAVIAFPANSLPFTAVPVSLLVFDKGRREQASVKMLDAAAWAKKALEPNGRRRADVPDGALAALPRMLAEGGGDVRAVAPDALQPDNLLPQQYLLAQASRVEDSAYGPLYIKNEFPEDWVALKEVAEVYRGINPAGKGSGDTVRMRVIKLSNVQEDTLLQDGVEECPVPGNSRLERYLVRPGDLLVSCKGPAIKMCAVPEDCREGLLLSLNFLGLRIDRTRFEPDYVLAYLKSPAGRQALARCQIGSSIVMIRAQDLEDIRIPYISLAQQRASVETLRMQETRIAQEIAALEAQRRAAQWDFYMKIGLGRVLSKEESHETD